MQKTTSILVNTIRENPDCEIYTILDSDNENLLKWRIKPTTLQIIPKSEGHYLVTALIIDKTGSYQTGYINLSTPERIADYVIFDLNNSQYSEISNLTGKNVIPAVASDCFGVYELYYSRNNPEFGIEILKKGLKISKDKSIIAEDLGYILRDEGREKEALEYFLISIENGSSSEFIFGEIENIYRSLGNNEKANEYKAKFEKH